MQRNRHIEIGWEKPRRKGVTAQAWLFQGLHQPRAARGLEAGRTAGGETEASWH